MNRKSIKRCLYEKEKEYDDDHVNLLQYAKEVYKLRKDDCLALAAYCENISEYADYVTDNDPVEIETADTILDEFEEKYIGIYDSAEDYVRSFYENDIEQALDEIPDYLRSWIDINWERAARDASFTSIDVLNLGKLGVAIFEK